jgi:hypothetical protein
MTEPSPPPPPPLPRPPSASEEWDRLGSINAAIRGATAEPNAERNLGWPTASTTRGDVSTVAAVAGSAHSVATRERRRVGGGARSASPAALMSTARGGIAAALPAATSAAMKGVPRPEAVPADAEASTAGLSARCPFRTSPTSAFGEVPPTGQLSEAPSVAATGQPSASPLPRASCLSQVQRKTNKKNGFSR